MPYFKRNGRSLYYETKGNGIPLILLHGSLGSSMIHYGIQLIDPELQKEFLMIAPDFRGFGKSRKRKWGEYVRSKVLMEDVYYLIDNHLKLKKVILCGYSLGGGIALKLAMKYPERVMGIILVSSPPIVASKKFILPLQSKPSHILKKPKKSKKKGFLKSKIWYLFKRQNKRNLFNNFKKKMSKDPQFYEKWEKIRDIPKINIYGKYDTVLPVKLIEFLENHLPNKKNIPLEADHGITHENHKEFKSILMSFNNDISKSHKTSEIK